MPTLEAMAAGGCVVARNASAMAEILGDAGVLIETADPKALASSISALLEAPTWREELATWARKRSQGFTIQRMARQTYASYSAAIAQVMPSDGSINVERSRSSDPARWKPG